MKGKYVIVEAEFGAQVPVLFSGGQEHKDFRELSPLWAGEFEIFHEDGNLKVACHGNSSSLNLEPGPHDRILIEAHFRMNEP